MCLQTIDTYACGHEIRRAVQPCERYPTCRIRETRNPSQQNCPNCQRVSEPEFMMQDAQETLSNWELNPLFCLECTVLTFL